MAVAAKLNFIVRLRVRKGAKVGQVVSLTKLPFVIGTAMGCHLRPTSAEVSSHHCALQTGPGGLAISDLGSATGTWVNGARIDRLTLIGDGDDLRIGPLEFDIRVEAIPRTPPLAAK